MVFLSEVIKAEKCYVFQNFSPELAEHSLLEKLSFEYFSCLSESKTQENIDNLKVYKNKHFIGSFNINSLSEKSDEINTWFILL